MVMLLELNAFLAAGQISESYAEKISFFSTGLLRDPMTSGGPCTMLNPTIPIST